MAPPLLTLQNIQLSFGGTPLLEGIDLTIRTGERLCLVGRNGSGKSTVLKIAVGLIEADDGTRFVKPGTTVRYLPQEPDIGRHDTVLAYVEAGLNPGDDASRAGTLLAALGLRGDQVPAQMSGGEARRAALARVMAPQPDILFLDEPTNHLDIVAINWLETELAATRSALVLVSHDRRFLETLTTTTVWIDRGQARRLASGFGEFEAWRDKVLADEETGRHKLDRKIVAEEHWVRYGVTARRKRNMGRMRALQDLRQTRRDARKATGVARLSASESGASGKLVIEAENLTKSYDGRAVVDGFSTKIQRGDRVGIIGPNGAGKTTLIKLLTATLTPDEGRVKLGTKLDMVTLDQSRDSLDGTMTLSDALTGGGGTTVKIGETSRHVIGYMKDFLFLPEQARTPISRLSGGERGRLMLARALASPSNLLVLDEPTNDLDLETLDLLQELLAEYSGTVLLVSHDRDFIDRVATSVFASNGDGRWTEYAGGYSDMLTQRGQPFGAGKSATSSKAKVRAPTTRVRGNHRSKLSFRDAHALKTLPQTISGLETTIGEISAKLADPTLYHRNPAAFAEISLQLETSRKDLSAAEEEWLELEMKREEIEAG